MIVSWYQSESHCLHEPVKYEATAVQGMRIASTTRGSRTTLRASRGRRDPGEGESHELDDGRGELAERSLERAAPGRRREDAAEEDRG